MDRDAAITDAGVPGIRRALYLWEGRALYQGEVMDNTPHSHHAVQVVLSPGKPFCLHVNDTSSGGICAIIPPDHGHRLEGMDADQVLILMDPLDAVARELGSRLLKDRTARIVKKDELTDYEYLQSAMASPHAAGDSAYASRLFDMVLAALPWAAPQRAKPMHDRVLRALEVIRQPGAQRVTVQEIASKVFLSESRLIHLFTKEVGIPIRRFLLWRRMVIGVLKVLDGASLTEAAHDAGFADSAHLSRTFRGMFGHTPKDILKNSRFVQVISCIR